jgi:hypothetical protein
MWMERIKKKKPNRLERDPCRAERESFFIQLDYFSPDLIPCQ